MEATQSSTMVEEDTRSTPGPDVPIVDYLVLGEDPHLRSWKCTACGALYFDRRNACAKCFGGDFTRTRLASEGTVRAYTVVHRAAPSIPTPYTSVVVDLDGGGVVKAGLVGITDTGSITPGLRVRMVTFEAGRDDNDTKAIAFGYTIDEETA